MYSWRVLGSPARHLADAKKPPPRVITGTEPFYEPQAVEAGLVGAGHARERERSSRQDPRDLSNRDTNSVSGILPAGFAGLSRARPACMVSRQVLRKRLVGVEGPGPLLTVAYRLWETWPHPAPSNADKESIG